MHGSLRRQVGAECIRVCGSMEVSPSKLVMPMSSGRVEGSYQNFDSSAEEWPRNGSEWSASGQSGLSS